MQTAHWRTVDLVCVAGWLQKTSKSSDETLIALFWVQWSSDWKTTASHMQASLLFLQGESLMFMMQCHKISLFILIT